MAGRKREITTRPERTEIARWLERKLEDRRWNQREAAARLGTSYQQVNKWVAGTQRPSWQWIVEIAHCFDADPMRLLVLAEWLPERLAPEGFAAEMAALATNAPWTPERVAMFELLVNQWRELDAGGRSGRDGRVRRSLA